MKFLLSVVAVCLTFIGFSQSKEESLKELQNGKLYIFTYDTTESGSAEYCKQYNSNLHDVFDSKRWDFCKVDYIQVTKIESFKSSNPEAFLLIPMELEFEYSPSMKLNQRKSGGICYFKIGRAKDYTVRNKLLKFNEYVDIKKPLHTAAMANFDIQSMFIGVGFMQKSLKKAVLTKEEIVAKKEEAKTKEHISNNQRLRTKTLYIDKDQLNGLSENDLKQLYKYPIKVTSLKEIVTAIKENKSDFTFIQIQMGAATQNKDMLMVINPEDFNYLALVTVEVGTYKLEKDIFEKLNKIAERE